MSYFMNITIYYKYFIVVSINSIIFNIKFKKLILLLLVLENIRISL